MPNDHLKVSILNTCKIIHADRSGNMLKSQNKLYGKYSNNKYAYKEIQIQLVVWNVLIFYAQLNTKDSFT